MINSKFPYTTSTIRGGTFFTMVIFVMLLVSSALMYYYFQRTRSLEREIMALRSGDPVESERGGLFSFLPWNQQDEAEAEPEPSPVAAAPTPAPVAEPASSSPPAASQTTAYDGLPPTGAASTPRPTTGQPDVSAGNDIPAYSGLSLTEDPTQSSDILPPTDPEEGNITPPGEVMEQEPDEEEVPPGEVNSMYDAPPQVRVRAPDRE